MFAGAAGGRWSGLRAPGSSTRRLAPRLTPAAPGAGCAARRRRRTGAARPGPPRPAPSRGRCRSEPRSPAAGTAGGPRAAHRTGGRGHPPTTPGDGEEGSGAPPPRCGGRRGAGDSPPPRGGEGSGAGGRAPSGPPSSRGDAAPAPSPYRRFAFLPTLIVADKPSARENNRPLRTRQVGPSSGGEEAGTPAAGPAAPAQTLVPPGRSPRSRVRAALRSRRGGSSKASPPPCSTRPAERRSAGLPFPLAPLPGVCEGC